MISCEKCDARINSLQINTREFSTCLNCGARIRTDVFPAAVRALDPVAKQEALSVEDDAGCFFHPRKKAVVHCDACGRFLCALCDIEMNGGHICFSCMESGKKSKSIETLENQRFLWDGLAIRLSIFPMIFFMITCITAPATIFLVFRYWKADSSITPRKKKWRFVIALIISLLQIAGWIMLIFFMIYGKDN